MASSCSSIDEEACKGSSVGNGMTTGTAECVVLCGQTTYLLQGIITFSISARKKIWSGVVPIAKSFLTPLSPPEVLVVAGQRNLEAP